MNHPLLSIIMPLYNSEKYVSEAVQSLLNQTFTDFELIIINDASTDNSLDIVRSLKDPRIRLYSNETNLGIVATRNKGLELANGRYIAPFDSDDIALPEKFRHQVAFLESHPDFGLLGSWVKLVDESGKETGKKWKLKAGPEEIRVQLLFRNYFVQSAVVIRREAIPAGGYLPGFDIGEDYRMWAEIANTWKTWNYPEYLVKYRVHSQSAVQRESSKTGSYESKIFQEIFKSLEMELDSYQASLLVKIKNSERIDNPVTMTDIENLLLTILRQNELLRVFDMKSLHKVIRNRWLKSCYKARSQSFPVFRIFINSPLSGLFIRK